MGKTISQEIDERIVAMWYLGYRRAEIRDQLHVSEGYISNVITTERQLVGEPRLESCRRFAAALSKTPFSVIQAQKALRFLNTCRTRNGMNLEDVIEAFPKLVEMCASYRISIRDLPIRAKPDLKAASELEERVETLKKNVAKYEEEIKQKIIASGYTDESLARAVSLYEFLSSYGISPDEPKKLKNAILAFGENNYDLHELVRKITEKESLAQSKEVLQQAIVDLGLKKKELLAAVEAINLKLQNHQRLLDKAENLKKMGCTEQILSAITEKIRLVAGSRGIPYIQATEEFEKEILAAYEPLNGLQTIIKSTRDKLSQYNAELSAIAEAVGKDRAAMVALRELQARQVPLSDIIAISKIIRNEISSLNDLVADVDEYGSLKKAIRAVKVSCTDLETNANELETKVSALESRKNALLQSNNFLQHTLVREVESMLGTIRDEKRRLVEGSISAHIDFKTSITALIDTIAALEKTVEDVTRKYAAAQGVLLFDPLLRASQGESIHYSLLVKPTLLSMNLFHSALPTFVECKSTIQAAINAVHNDVDISIDE